jgi:hypothetical protein
MTMAQSIAYWIGLSRPSIDATALALAAVGVAGEQVRCGGRTSMIGTWLRP